MTSSMGYDVSVSKLRSLSFQTVFDCYIQLRDSTLRVVYPKRQSHILYRSLDHRHWTNTWCWNIRCFTAALYRRSRILSHWMKKGNGFYKFQFWHEYLNDQWPICSENANDRSLYLSLFNSNFYSTCISKFLMRLSLVSRKERVKYQLKLPHYIFYLDLPNHIL
jgi:hypothetical protein